MRKLLTPYGFFYKVRDPIGSKGRRWRLVLLHETDEKKAHREMVRLAKSQGLRRSHMVCLEEVLNQK